MNVMVRYVIIISMLSLIVSCWNRNTLGDDIKLLPYLDMIPLQSKVELKPFTAEINGETYKVMPEYRYELYGLVVSFRHHDGNFGAHKMWGDHINVADLCIIWSDTASSKYLSRLDFWNGEFTCNIQTSDNQAWSYFKKDQLSNNHLISDDEYIRAKIRDVSIGDQIRISGWLSSYSGANGGIRGTSTVRTDSGNGACETIFVNEIEILQSDLTPWRKMMYLSLFVLLTSIFVYFKTPYRAN